MLYSGDVERIFEKVCKEVNREAAARSDFVVDMSIPRDGDKPAKFYSVMQDLEQHLLKRYKGYYVSVKPSQCGNSTEVYVSHLN